MKEELSPVGVWGKSRPGRRNGWSRVREGKAIGDKVRERVGPRLCRLSEAYVRNLAFSLSETGSCWRALSKVMM